MPTEISDQELAEIGAILKTFRTIDIGNRKSDFIKRRIALRMRLTNINKIPDYCRLLQQKEQELELLLRIITIHVSQFFRNPSMFEKLKCDILPGIYLTAKNAGNKSVQIYSLGCAGGEEPYSIAILLKEHFIHQLQQTATNIVAVDVDSHTLKAAKHGEFSEDKLKNISDGVRQSYFRQKDPLYELTTDIRRMVSFLQADITENLGYDAADLVLCRNTLIYFTRTAQEIILDHIANLLSIGGVLILGKSETMVGSIRNRFEPVCRIERIYRKIC